LVVLESHGDVLAEVRSREQAAVFHDLGGDISARHQVGVAA
jgi:hypothetical protein